MEKQMQFVSTFTGVGMFDLGLMRAGMECIHQVEIDEHCQSVLRHRFPNIPKSKDIYEVAKSAGTIAGSTFDLLVGGSPCQSFSVAGRRQGLEGESQLWYEYHRLLDEYRPTWFIWENVPGVLSSGPTNDAGDKLAGYDFSVILSGFTGSYQPIPKKGWRNSGVANGPFYTVAWRILDARHWGVAQRRRRVFVIGRLAAAGGSPAEILFERESAGWYLSPSKPPRKNPAAAAERTAGGSYERSGIQNNVFAGAAHSLSPYDVAPTLAASGAGTARPSISNAGHEFLAISAFQEAGFGEYSEAKVAGTLRTAEGGGGTRLQNIVATTFRMRAFGDYVEEDDAASAIAARDYKDARDIVAVTPKPNQRFFDQETNQWCVIDNDGVKRVIDQSFAPGELNTLTPWDREGKRIVDANGIAPTIAGSDKKGGRSPGGAVLVPKATVVDVRNPATSDEISGTLQHKKSGGYSLNYQNPVIVPKEPIVVKTDNTQSNGWGVLDDGTTHTLGGAHDAVVAFMAGQGAAAGSIAASETTAPTLRGSSSGTNQVPSLASLYGIRRFTPIETERLQGLPDDWTRWRDDGKEQSDAQRYAQCGNGGAVPILHWLGKRIMAYEED